MSRPGSSSTQRRRDELGIAQKMFNQRLLAEHCWTEAQAQHIYTDEILPSCSATGDSGPRDISLIDTIKLCNSHLSDFGLEIVSITVPDYTNQDSNDDDDDEEEEDEERPQRHPISSNTIKYYTMVNKFPDTITKEVYQNYLFQPPTLQSYVKQVLLHLARHYPTPSTRATLLNLKNNTNENLSSTTSHDGDGHASQATSTSVVVVAPPKVSLSNAEDMLERLLDEQWVMEVVTTNRNHKSQRRNSTTNTKIAIGPRALGELSYLISSPAAGTDEEEDDNDNKPSASSNHHLKVLLPQPIYIRY